MPSAEWSPDQIAEMIRTCRRLGVPHFRLGDLEFRVDLAFRGRARAPKTETAAVTDESDPIDDGEDEPEDWRVARDRRYSEARAGVRSR